MHRIEHLSPLGSRLELSLVPELTDGHHTFRVGDGVVVLATTRAHQLSKSYPCRIVALRGSWGSRRRWHCGAVAVLVPVLVRLASGALAKDLAKDVFVLVHPELDHAVGVVGHECEIRGAAAEREEPSIRRHRIQAGAPSGRRHKTRLVEDEGTLRITAPMIGTHLRRCKVSSIVLFVVKRHKGTQCQFLRLASHGVFSLEICFDAD